MSELIQAEAFASSVKSAVEKSKLFLASDEAMKSVARDPYWPKWDSPWWHMLLLNELGLAEEIPKTILRATMRSLDRYLSFFPVREADLPPGIDTYRDVPCFCQVGSLYQILFNSGIDVDVELPWMKEWFLKYQQPNGGLNCDEKSYLLDTPKGSIVSTLPCLEAVLFCRRRDLSISESLFLQRGAEFLLRHRLFRRLSNGEVISNDWLEVRFPRFYEYDFFRGFYFLAKWREVSGFQIPDDLVDEVENLMAKQVTHEGLVLRRYNLFDKRSYNPSDEGIWKLGSASEFALMKAVSFDGALCPQLLSKWNEVRPKSAIVIDAYETVYKQPIVLRVGDKVDIEKRETNPEWLGWVFCRSSSGAAGWVSERCLKADGVRAVVVKDYDATELDAKPGEELKVYREEFGWSWCRNIHGKKGWVPNKNLRIANNRAF